MLSINSNSTAEERRLFFKEKVMMLAKANGVAINIVPLEQHIEFFYLYGKPSARCIFIHEGNIYVDQYQDEQNVVEYELVFHEVLHILSVPKRYRSLMCHDTEKSYKTVKQEHKYKDTNRLATESAVIGAQAILFKKIKATGWLGGSFFRGHIREYDEYDGSSSTDVPQEYMERGRKLLRRLNLSLLR